MERVASAGIVASIVVNDHPERGQTSSLQTGLRHLPPADAFLIFPVDYVLVESVDVSAVIDAFCRPGPRRPPIVIPSWRNRRGHPVLVDLALRAEFLALTQGASARTVIDAHAAEIAYVQASCDSVLQDMDTPGDYRCCLDRLRQRG